MFLQAASSQGSRTSKNLSLQRASAAWRFVKSLHSVFPALCCWPGIERPGGICSPPVEFLLLSASILPACGILTPFRFYPRGKADLHPGRMLRSQQHRPLLSEASSPSQSESGATHRLLASLIIFLLPLPLGRSKLTSKELPKRRNSQRNPQGQAGKASKQVIDAVCRQAGGAWRV